MLGDLKFVQGAVAKKDYQPALTHFRVTGGRVAGFNGTIALSSPIALDITATPKAVPFVKAIERCTDETTTVVYMTEGGKLALKSGGFRAFIECHDDGDILDSIAPEGTEVPIADTFLEGIRALLPYVGTDASRPWATGILLRDYSAYATNNIVLAEYWIGSEMPNINLPTSALNELVRIGAPPIRITLGEQSITFFFEGDRWMRSQLLNADWPNVAAMLNTTLEAELMPFPEGFFEAVETIIPFVGEEGRIYFRQGRVTTSPHEGEGASVDIEGLPDYGAYHHKHLMSLQGVATSIDFTPHPQACPFQGEKLRGVVMGMVDQ